MQKSSNDNDGFDQILIDALGQQGDFMQALAEATQHEQDGASAVWDWGHDSVEADSDARMVTEKPPLRERVPSAALVNPTVRAMPFLHQSQKVPQQRIPETAWNHGQTRASEPKANGFAPSTQCRIGENKYALSQMTDSSGSALFDYDEPRGAQHKTSPSRTGASVHLTDLLHDTQTLLGSSDEEMLTDVDESVSYFQSEWLKDLPERSTCSAIPDLHNTLKLA